MKVIPLSEAKAHLSHYARVCHDEPVVVTVNGVPAFQLAPLEEEDNLKAGSSARFIVPTAA